MVWNSVSEQKIVYSLNLVSLLLANYKERPSYVHNSGAYIGLIKLIVVQFISTNQASLLDKAFWDMLN